MSNFRKKAIASALGSLLFAGAAQAAMTFQIHEFEVEGDRFLSPEEISAITRPFTGEVRGIEDIGRAREALQQVYKRMGYETVRVDLPDQELSQGKVRLKVVERPVASVRVQNAKHFSNGNIYRSLPGLKPGILPNAHELQRAIAFANENPAKKVRFGKRDTPDGAAVDVVLDVVDKKPWMAYAMLDNTGTQETGHGRVSLGFQHFNVFGRDHRFMAQLITNVRPVNELFDPDKNVTVLGMAYTIPLYSLGDSIDFLAAYSDVESGRIQGLFNVSGKGTVLGAHYTHNLESKPGYTHKVVGGIDYRAFRNDIEMGGGGINVAHVTTTPWSLGYVGQWQGEDQLLAFGVTGIWNLTPGLARNGSDDAFRESGNAENFYSRYTFNADYRHVLPKGWELHAVAEAQYTPDHLIGGEQFRVGGAYSVRGWHESAVTGDKGYRWSIEAITPDFGNLLHNDIRLRALAFIDHGQTGNQRGVDGAQAASGSSIGSVGLGLRAAYSKSLQANLDVARVVDGDKTRSNPEGSRRPGDLYGHASITWFW